MTKPRFESSDLTAVNIEKLAELFPAAVSEGKVNFDLLRTLLGDEVFGDEAYEFTWVGKREAIREAGRPIRKTLRPCMDKSKNWDTTENLYIEGDNLDVLKLLHETYLGKVKMIYIDPPYNTGNDFVYNDDFAEDAEEYLERTNQKDDQGQRLSANKETSGRYHSDWLSMMYMRLKLARDLLADNGAIFISIDDNEITNLRKICEEIFGESNFIAQFIWKKKQGGGNDSNHVVTEHEYILAFGRNISNLKLNLDKKYKLDDNLYPFKDEKGEYGLVTLDKSSIQFSQSLVFEITDKEGNKYMPRVVKGKQSCWRWSRAKVEAEFDSLVFKNEKVYTKYYRPDGVTPKSLLIDAIYGRTESGNDDIKKLFEINPFSYPKPVDLVEHFISIMTSKTDTVLDFFSGSGTTAHAVMRLNSTDGESRRFIMIQLDEPTDEKKDGYKAGYKTIPEIGRERIRRAGKQMSKGDIGFRTLKLADSNMREVFYNPSLYDQSMILGLDKSIKEDRTAEDVLFQVMLDKGVKLCSKIEKRNGYYIVGSSEHGLVDLICSFEKIDLDKIKEIAKLQPECAVFLDSQIKDDATRTNIQQIFKTYSPKTKVEVL